MCLTVVITGNVYNKIQFLINLGSVLARFHYVCVPLNAFIVSYCMLCCQPACTKRGTLSVCHVCDIIAYFLCQI